MTRTFLAEAIVLKRINFKDADRIITVFSKQKGKLVGIAKGVRKITSRKRAFLEPGNHVKIMFAVGKSLNIITQAELIKSHAGAKANLQRITQTNQILEIVDALTAEEEPHPTVFLLLSNSLSHLEGNGNKKQLLLQNIRLILKDLGFTHDKKFSERGLKNYIEELAEKKLKSKEFLTPNSQLS